jgi:hypothetical protein
VPQQQFELHVPRYFRLKHETEDWGGEGGEKVVKVEGILWRLDTRNYALDTQ